MESNPVAAPRDVYVGPRPFLTGERLFGRDREVTALGNLLMGERVVLLYSPSGAGKTSLIQAGLVPRFRGAGARARPFVVPAKAGSADPAAPAVIIRVHTPTAVPGANRYVLSALGSLEEHRPAAARRPVAELAGSTLAGYLAEEFPARSADGTFRPTVLFLDQFEEVLTQDPTDKAAKEAFFAQLGEVLADRGRWVLIAIREDYLAGLDPYLRFLPGGRLNTRFRLDRLAETEALEAVRGPAAAAGVEFAAGVAEKLVDDLRLMRVQQPDNTFVDKPGPYVEPVHLQVVCKSLWDLGSSEPGKITEADIRRLGRGDEKGNLPGVDRVLATYYRDQVAKAARAGETSERRLRDWFDRVLISAALSRRSAPRGEEGHHGVTPAALGVLSRAYLVREESRSGGWWLELAHDRLIGPVRRDNADWRSKHLTRFQLAATVWVEAGRPTDVPIDPTVLREGHKTVAAKEATADERAFLKAGLERAAARRATFRNRLVGAGLGALIGLAAVAVVLWNQSKKDRQRAAGQAVVQFNQDLQVRFNRQARAAAQQGALVRNLEAHARDIQARGTRGPGQTTDPAADVREALELVRRAAREKVDLPAGETALRAAVERLGWFQLRRIPGPVRAAAFSPDGKWFAVGGPDFGVAWWAVRDGRPSAHPDGQLSLNPEQYGVTALAFAPDNATLLLGTKTGRICLWRLDRPLKADDYPQPVEPNVAPEPGDRPRPLPPTVGPNHRAAVRSIQVASERAPDGRPWVVSIGTDGSGFLWKWQTREVIALDQTQEGPPVPLTAVGFTPYPKMLYAGSTTGVVSGWDLRQDRGQARPQGEKTRAEVKTAVTALAIHPAALFLAVAAYRSGITLWPMDPYSKILSESVRGERTVLQAAGYVETLAFHPTGGWLAAESRDKKVTVYRQARGPSKSPYEPFQDSAFSPDKYWPAAVYAFDGSAAPVNRAALPPWLLVGAADGPVRLWDLAAEAAPLSLPSGRSPPTAAAVSPDRAGAVVGCQDGSIHYYDLRPRTGYAPAEPRVFYGPAFSFRSSTVVSNDNRHLSVFDQDGVLEWDLAAAQPKPRVFAPGARIPPVFGRGTVVTRDRQWVVSVRPVGEGFELFARPIDGDEPKGIPIPDTGRRDQGPAPLLAVSADGRTLAGVVSGRLYTWTFDPATGAVGDPRPLTLRDGEWVECLAVAPAGSRVAAGTRRGAIFVWELPARPGRETPVPLMAYEGGGSGLGLPPERAVTGLAFAPSGSRLVSAGRDLSVRLWDAHPSGGWKRPVLLPTQPGFIEYLIVLPAADAEPDRLVIGTDTGHVRVYTLDTDRLLDRAARLVGGPGGAK